MRILKKKGIGLVIAIILLFILPFTVQADEKYRVTFDSKGGNEVNPIEVDTWEEVLLLMSDVVNPSMYKDGFVFEDWYLDEEYIERFDYKNDGNHNIILYARWFKSIDMSKVNLTVDDLIEGTEYSVKVDDESVFSRVSTPTPSVGISNTTHVNLDGVIIGYTDLSLGYVEGTIQMGNDYYIDILILPDDGYLFSWQDEAKMLINGKETQTDYTNNVFMDLTNIEVEEYGGVIVERSKKDALLRVRVKAKEKEKIDMSKVNLVVDDLIEGTEYGIKDDNTGGFSKVSTPTPNIRISNNTHVKLNGAIIGYTDLNLGYIEGTIQMGNDYYIDILIQPDDGYLFSWQDEAKMLINGKETLMDYKNHVFMDLANIEVEEYGGVIVDRSERDALLRVRVKAKEKESILKGDMNNNGKIDLKDIILLIKKYLGID